MENLASKENAVCCLCGKTLKLRSALVVAFYAGIGGLDGSQNLYAHENCLKNHLAVDVALISELADEAEFSSEPLTPGIMESLAQYVGALLESTDTTNRSEDRPRYERHLAQSARMFYAIRRDPALDHLAALVAEERRAFGWSFLSGDERARVDRT